MESDSINAVRTVNGNCSLIAAFLILNDIKILMNDANNGSRSYIFRNGNEAAHTLTKFVFSIVKD